MSSTYDRWLCDGPPIHCDDCGEGLGLLNDGLGWEIEDSPGSRSGRLVCERCYEEYEDMLAGEEEDGQTD